MRLEINNLRGIAHEVVEIGDVAVIRRDNTGGKTTIAAAAAACLGRDSDPLALGVRQAARYVRDGAEAKDATAVLTGPGWEIIWLAGRGTFTIEGSPPEISAMAARVGKPLIAGNRQMAGQEWLSVLEGAALTESEIADALWQHLEFVRDARPWVDRIAQALESADDAGWQREYDYAQDRVVTGKRAWQDIVAEAGEHEIYGVAKAAPWVPSGWSPQLEGLSAEAASRAVTEAENEVTAARDALAVAKTVEERRLFFTRQIDAADETISKCGNDLDGLSDGAPDLQPLQQALERAQAALGKARAEADAVQHRRDVSQQILQAAQQDHRNAHAALTEAEMKNSHFKGQRKDAERRLTKLECDLKEAEHVLADYEDPQDQCNLCGRMKSDFPKFMEDRRAGLDQRKRDVARIEASKKNWKEMLGEIPDDTDLAPLIAARDEAAATIETCEATLDSEDGAYQAAENLVRETEKAVRLAREALEAAEVGPRETEAKRSALQARIAAAKETQAQAKDAIAGISGSDTDALQITVDDAVSRAGAAREAQRLIRIRDDARRAHEDVIAWTAVAKELSPVSGLRARRLTAALDEINAVCRRISASAGFGDVEITRSKAGIVSVVLDGRPTVSLSGAEQWIAEAAVRAAICIRHNCPLLVIDGADILQTDRRARFYDMLHRLAQTTGLKVLITETE